VDLLTYRLNLLKNTVDYNIIVESKITHSGKEKPLISDDIKDLFAEFKDKIIHVIVDDFPFKYPNIDYTYPKLDQWANENFQRNCISRGLELLNLSDEDIFIVSDLDEIPDPNLLTKIKNKEINVTINSLEMDFYIYNLNSIANRKWTTGKIVSYKLYKDLSLKCQDIRHYTNSPIIPNGGWHLTFFGDKYFVRNKLQHWAHQEYNEEQYTNLEIIDKNMNDKIVHDGEIFNSITIAENNYLPPYYEIYLNKYYQ
jgi:beta-1,4-mannosyl-glycoprotein beta-1,4-N-acetylglucosaminyltransferase